MGRVYKAEFRHEAVRLALSSGLSRERIAQDLGIGSSTLKKWIRDAQKLDTVVADLSTTALQRAIALRQPPPGCVHHADRGSQYCSEDYRKVLSTHGFIVSMSRKGNCWDNAVTESFFKTVKAELLWRHAWMTRQEVEQALTSYINDFYNPQRLHSTLQWKSPLDYERNAA